MKHSLTVTKFVTFSFISLDSLLSDTVPTIPMLDTHKPEDTQAGLVPTLPLDNQAIPTLEWVVILIPVYNLTQVSFRSSCHHVN